MVQTMAELHRARSIEAPRLIAVLARIDGPRSIRTPYFVVVLSCGSRGRPGLFERIVHIKRDDFGVQ
jgi:hypothetical protein